MIPTGIIPIEAALPQPLVRELDARARRDGITRERELQHAIEHYLAWQHNQGEMRWRDDVAYDFEQHLPSDSELL